ncbi:MAG TPA: lamin tail domain-containing protein, partial [Bacillota bacterium]|nr:lamin tail domain-containing protein [Bacillota bacterium]
TGINPGASWMLPGYNDGVGGWVTGAGVFDGRYSGTNPAPRATVAGETVGTQLAMRQSGTNVVTFYFRTSFPFHPGPASQVAEARLLATALLDDGAVFYLNGQEGYRVGVTNTAHNAWASRVVDATHEQFELPVTNLVDGDNLIAVEVHQCNSGSSDVTFGLALEAAVSPRLRDTNAPVIADLIPGPGSTVSTLTQFEVHFSEAVQGVRAGDLLINTVPATNLTVYAPDVYVFAFPQPATGLVQVAWSATQAITDTSANANRFGGGSYTYTLDSRGGINNVRINEFMAGNNQAVPDEDGHYSDWIELYNAGDRAVDLGGWYLTDNVSKLTKWRFPQGTAVLGKAYLLVWASGNNRTNPLAPLHTSFKLDKGAGNFLGLVYSNGTSIISAITSYPQQYDDVSYGRDRVDSTFLGYFTNATPGKANATVGASFAPAVSFSRRSGTFQGTFGLALSTESTNLVIRYVLVTNTATAAWTNVPNSSSPLYTGPLTIGSSVQVRARAFPAQPNIFPGPPASQTYVQINAGAAAFNSSTPIVLFHNFGGGKPPVTTDQAAVMMVFGTSYGRASLANPPDVVSRVGMNLRGSSTQGFPKSSYAVETWDEFNQDQAVEVLGLPAESDWVFYGVNYYDKPLLHNAFMYELCRSLGRYSSRVRLVEVFNSFSSGPVSYTSPTLGNYNGVYVLEEKVKAGPGRVAVPRLGPSETNAATISGGYVLKIDRADSGERSLYAGNQSLVYVEPNMDDYAVAPGRAVQESYIRNWLDGFYTALNSYDWTDPVTGYAAWIDVDSWIDYHILNVLSRNADSLRLSAYLYKDRNKRLEMGPSWDFDRSLGTSAGNDWRAWNPRSWMGSNPLGSAGSSDYGTDYFNADWAIFANPWYSQLFWDPDFWQRWIDRYQELRPGAFSTNSIFNLVDTLANQVREAQPRESSRWIGSGTSDTTPRLGYVGVPAGWPDTRYTYIFPGTYQGEIDFMKRWLADRLEFLDTNFLAKPVLSAMGGLVSAGFRLTLTAPGAEAGTTLYYTLDGTDPRLPGGYISPSAYSGTAPLTLVINNNVRVVARNWNPAHQNLTGYRNPPLSSGWSGPAAATFVVTTPSLAITEIMYHPPAAGTNDGGLCEFIELKNVGTQPLNLVGIRFTNGIDFTFTVTNPITSLAAGKYVVLVKDRAAFASRYPTVTNIGGQYSGSLENGGERLYLEGALREPILDFSYKDGWYPTTDGRGFSLVIRNEAGPFWNWTNAASWRASSGLNGSPGRADNSPPAIPPVVINEALTHTDLPEVDTIELYNPTAEPAPIGGWFLTDDANNPMKFRIPTNTVVPAGGCVLFTESQYNTGGTNSFALSSLGEEVYLFSGDGTNLTGYRHGFAFGAQINGVTFGRYVSSDGVEHFVTERARTLGRANAGPKVGPVVLSELIYSPKLLGLDTDTLDEYIELRNFSGQAVPLFDPLHPTNTWRLDGGVQFGFPQGVMLAPWSYLLVVNFDPAQDPVAVDWFRSRYNLSSSTPLYGPYQGNLANEGERIGLYQPDKPEIPPSPVAGFVPYVLVEEVHYSNQSPWPVAAAGTGNSLGRIFASEFADDPINWQAGTPSPGRA